MTRVPATVACILFVAFTACMKEQTTPGQGVEDSAAPDERATYTHIVESINERVPTLTAVTGTYTVGDATSDYRAYYDAEGALLHIHEHLDLGAYGSSVNRYYFHNGTLLYSEEDKLSRGMSESGARQTRMIVQWMVFDSSGVAIQAEKNVDGIPRAPETDEAEIIVKHVEALRAAASHKSDQMHMGAVNPSNN